ncbi:zinc-dependent metalloprotease [Parenemella sanctibonifatiensis]|nr:zinc-dependent metalloprotease [Parenemella sanctibonifatiensis]
MAEDNPGSGPQENPELPPQLIELLRQLGLTGPDGQVDMNQMMSQLGQVMGQMSNQMRSAVGDAGESGTNWPLAKETARRFTAQQGPDPSVDHQQRRELLDAVDLVQTWIDEATTFPAPASLTAQVWSRAEWVEKTMPRWQEIVTPVATSLSQALGSLMNEAEDDPMAAMLAPMMRAVGASMYATQLGQALGTLSTHVVSGTDVGIPLTKPDEVALLPVNVEKFGEGLSLEQRDVTLYLVLRELVRHRLFASVPWLSGQLSAMIEHFAREIRIDPRAIEDAMEEMDPTSMDAAKLDDLGQNMAGRLFKPERTPEQEEIVARLEVLLALIEGWVDDVVAQITERWMPHAQPLAEAVRRRRATSGPTEETFKVVVGLELRPRRVRDAAALWGALRSRSGAEERDGIWRHPDMLPTASDLDDPMGYTPHAPDQPSASDDMDAELARLLGESGAGDDPHQDGSDQSE